MKKRSILAAVLAAALLAGCGGSTASSAPSSAAASSAPESVSAAQSAASSQAAGTMVAGVWNGSSYTNEWTGLSFELPSGWFALTRDQINTQLGVGADMVASGLNADAGELSTQIGATDFYEFYTSNATGMGFFFLDVFDRVAAGVPNMTPEEYLQQTAALYEGMSNMTATCTDITADTFYGNDGSNLGVKLETEAGTSLQNYFVIEKDQYLLCYAVGANDEAAVSEVQELLAQIG